MGVCGCHSICSVYEAFGLVLLVALECSSFLSVNASLLGLFSISFLFGRIRPV